MPIDVADTTHNVFLKLNVHGKETASNQVDTIPLKVTSIAVDVSRTVPAIPVPLSSIARGQSETIAVDLGMASKSITIQGVITSGRIRRSHTGTSPNFTAIDMTASELAQLIASGVDSSGLAHYQNFNELVFLIESNIDENYVERQNGVERIPFTFASRGAALEKDNARVPLPANFPEDATSTGLTGFIEQFGFTLDAEEPLEVAFNMNFRVATIFP
jgi:hypothetical protein